MASLSAHPELGISEADATAIYRDVGRLTAPLWITGEWEHVPELTLVSAASLDATIGVTVIAERRFDETRSEFRTPLREDVVGSLNRELLSSLRSAT